MLTKLCGCLLSLLITIGHPHTTGYRPAVDAAEKVSVIIHVKGIFEEKDGQKIHRIGCSGTYVRPQVILTAAHCFEGYTPIDIWVRGPDDKKGYPADLLKTDARLDLALLDVEKTHSYAKLGPTPHVGDDVVNIGSPLGLEFLASEGIVSALNYKAEDFTGRYMITTAMINSGSSGGGAFDSKGRLIGVNTMALGLFGWMGISMAVDLATIKTFLK